MGWESGLNKPWPHKLTTLGVAILLWLGFSTTVQAHSNPAAALAISCPAGTVIYVNQQATGANTGDSWTNAFPQLQDALTLADSCPAVREIWVAKGVYYPDEGSNQTNNSRNASFQLRKNLAIYGGFVGNETLLNTRNWQTNVTVLSGDLDQNDPGKDANGILSTPPTQSNGANNAYHVVAGIGVTTTAVLDGFAITSGRAEGTPAVGCACGGGIYASSAPTLRNLSVVGNYAGTFGGGFYLTNSQATLQNLIVKANQASLYGAGLYNDNSSPTIINTLFSGNSASNRGGALYNNNSNPVLINVTISGNRASSRAGAFYNTSSNPDLVNVIIWGNEASTNANIENSSTSHPKYRYSLVEGSGGSTAWNTAFGDDHGNNVDSNPLFVTAVNAASAPTTAGNLRLQSGSRAADAGLSSANLTSIDVEGAARLQSAAIDLGAYESAYTAQLSVSTTLTPPVIEFHEPVTYTIVISNSGNAYAYHTQVTDTLPAQLTLAQWQTQPTGAAYDSGANTVAWDGTVAASTAVTFTFITTHIGNPDETVTNTVTISHPTGGGSDAAAFVVLPLPDLTIADTLEPEARG